jgi:hypothetical protein
MIESIISAVFSMAEWLQATTKMNTSWVAFPKTICLWEATTLITEAITSIRVSQLTLIISMTSEEVESSIQE